LRETEVSLAFDGGNNVGMLALFHAAQATIKKTAAHGIALVSKRVFRAGTLMGTTIEIPE
jgi:LDH2 family malate/lactate/ureidoglycolate dehydrogenase